MKYLLILTLLCSLLTAEEKMTFQNGDKWHGDLIEMKEGLIHFKSPLTDGNELLFNSDHLKSLSLKSSVPSKGNYKVALTNGDGFLGDLIELNDKHLVLKTDIAGVLQIPRSWVKEVVSDRRSLISNGLNPDQWQGKLSDEGFLNGTVMKDLAITEPVIITVELMQNQPDFNMTLVNSDRNNRFYAYLTLSKVFNNLNRVILQQQGAQIVGNGNVQIVVNGVQVQPQQNQPQQNQPKSEYMASGRLYHGTSVTTLGQHKFPQDDERVRLQMFIDPKTGFVAYVVNGKPLGKSEIGEVDLKGAKLTMRSRKNAKITGFTVERWDGNFSPQSGEEAPEEDNIFLKNGDIAQGKITKVTDSQVHFSCKLGDLKIPMDRLVAFNLANPDEPKESKEVQLIQHNGMTISGLLQKIDKDNVYLKTKALKEITLNRKFFTSLVRQKVEVQVEEGTLKLKLGDNTIHGKVTSYKADGIDFKNMNLIDSCKINPESLLSITNVNKTTTSDYCFELTNGDKITGSDISLKNNLLTFRHCGKKMLLTTDKILRLYNKKTNIDTSRMNRGRFSQNVALPERSEISFKYKSNINNNRVRISSIVQLSLFRGENRFQYYAQISANPNIRGKRYLQRTEHKKLKVTDEIDFTLKCDKKNAIFELWANGVHTHTFKDPKGFQAEGDYISIYTYGGQAISDLSFRRWGEKEGSSKTFVIDSDWNRYEGTIKEISDNKVKINNKTISFEKLKEITFASQTADKVKSSHQIKLQGGGILHVSSFEIVGDIIKISHQTLGKIELNLSSALEVLKLK